MIVVRISQCAKYGMGDQLLALLMELNGLLRRDPRVSGARVLTDLGGRMFRVETEFQVESLAVWEQLQSELLTGAEFARWFARVQPLVEKGHRDFLTVRT